MHASLGQGFFSGKDRIESGQAVPQKNWKSINLIQKLFSPKSFAKILFSYKII